MNVSRPLRSVVPTLDGPVLEVLAGTTRPLSGRQVSRLTAKASVRGVQLVLARLVAHGLVRAEDHPPATLYSANRSHIAWPMIEALVGLHDLLLQRIRECIADWPIAPVHVSLFGSSARRDGDERSDIDLLILRPDSVGEDDEDWEAQLDALRGAVRDWTGNRCQTFALDHARLAEYVEANDPLVRSWLRDGVLVAGDPLRDTLSGRPMTVEMS